ncbi:MAG: molybdate ABC transporter substrate-binding protein [Acidobacteriota bacterium]
MHRRLRHVGLLLSLLAGGARVAAADPAAPAKRAPIVFAAASLKEAVTEIADAWTKRTGVEVRLQFEATSTLAKQIQEGAPCDVFITAAPEWLDKLPVTKRFDWLGNTLVCVVKKDDKDFDIKKLESLAIGNEQVPAGKYARAALESLKVPLPERTVYGQNVRNVLSTVAEGGARAGIVYATDAAVEPSLRVAYVFPPESHPKIVYSVGLLTAGGQTFYDALADPSAREVARRWGFADLK